MERYETKTFNKWITMSFDLKLIDGDFSIKNGDVEKTEGINKLFQDINKICLTKVGSNPLQPWYGSYLTKALIGSTMNTSLIKSLGKNQLQKSLENLKQLQELQINTGQKMSLDEQIAAITNITVDISPVNPSVVLANIFCLTKTLKTFSTTIEI